MRALSESAASTSSSLAWSMKRREVTTVRMPAVSSAAESARAPAVKLSIAGTRPWLCNAKKVATTPATLGSSTPTRSPFSVPTASLRPSTWAASTSCL